MKKQIKRSHYSSHLKTDSATINNEYLVPGIPLQWLPKRVKMISVSLEVCANNIT